jgi:hypothetical protein
MVHDDGDDDELKDVDRLSTDVVVDPSNSRSI